VKTCPRKRGEKSLERVPATSTEQNVTCVPFGIDAFEYLQMTFNVSALLPLRYFRIFIGGYLLMALVDLGSSRTILGHWNRATPRAADDLR